MEIDAHHLIIATRYQLLDPKPVIWWREVSPSGSGWMSLNPYNPNPRWHPKNDYLLLEPGHKPTVPTIGKSVEETSTTTIPHASERACKRLNPDWQIWLQSAQDPNRWHTLSRASWTRTNVYRVLPPGVDPNASTP